MLSRFSWYADSSLNRNKVRWPMFLTLSCCRENRNLDEVTSWKRSTGMILTIIVWSFCDIQKNQGRGTGMDYQPQPSASADNPFRDLHYSESIVSLYIERKKITSNTKRANLTRLPLEIMHLCHIWHDYSLPLTWLLYNRQLDDVADADFRKFTVYAFGQSEKR